MPVSFDVFEKVADTFLPPVGVGMKSPSRYLKQSLDAFGL
jgi:hypothetical protein